MKKIFKLMMFLIICAFLCVSNSYASRVDEIKLQSRFKYKYKYTFGFATPNFYYSKQKLESNNRQVYNFNMPYNKEFEIYNIYEGIPDTSISKDIFLKIKEIAYYGDMKYSETQDDLYYFLTQGLMIKTLKPNNFTYGLNSKYTLEEVEEQENLLVQEMANYFKKPSFDNKKIDLNLNQTITLSDDNNILPSYVLEENDSDIVSYEVIDNKIVLKALKPGDVTFRLKKEFKDKDHDMEFLFKEIKGTPITPINFALTSGNFAAYSTFKVQVNENTSRVGLDIKDDKTSLDDEKLNVSYGIYNQKDELVYQINTDIEGLFYTDYLPFDKYYIKEISNNDIYIKNNNIYEVNLDSNEDKVIIIENHKKDLSKNKPVDDKLRQINISFLDEEGRLIKKDVDISIMDKLYQINGQTSLILKDGNYLIKFLKIPEDYVLENETTILNVNDNVELEIVLKHKEEGYGYETIDVPNTWAVKSVNYLFIFIGLRYVKKFSKW